MMINLSTSTVFSYLIVFGVALGLSLLLCALSIPLGFRLGIVDIPRNRHLHPKNTSKFGGFGLFVSFTVAAILAQFMPIERGDPKEVIRFIGLILGGIFTFVLGVWDSKWELPPLPQYIGQLLAAAIAVAFLIFIEKFNNPLTGEVTDPWPYVVTVTLSLFWMGLMMNTVNWLDGMDGLAAGVVFIAAILLFIHTVREQQLSVSLLPLALIGTTFGYLCFNWNPARLFMGGGSLFLGYTLGALSIIGGAKMATILLVMGLPLLDVSWQIIQRLRAGKNPMIGDRGHIHFRLIDMGVPVRVIAIGYYLFCSAFGILALITTSRQFKLVAMITMFGLIIAGFGVVTQIMRRKAFTPPSLLATADPVGTPQSSTGSTGTERPHS
jgi:UDP-GlcNAc:undecaprenyl-phosphate GlcNAc-1-phosphate transferase